MIKNADYIYTIGKSHTTCDDFSYYKDYGSFQVGIVCDGCSSSKHTDIGSRLLVSEILRNFKERPTGFDECVILLEASLFSCFFAFKNIYGDNFLDCTIIFSLTFDNITKVYMIGDGSILATKKDGTKEITTINFENNAPAYLSYKIDKNRKEQYLKLSNKYTIKKRVEKQDSDFNKVINISTDDFSMQDIPVNIFEFKHSEYKNLICVTDGIDSFISEGKSISAGEQLLDLKTLNGFFFQRQVFGIKKLFEKQNIYNQDDLSGVALIFE